MLYRNYSFHTLFKLIIYNDLVIQYYVHTINGTEGISVKTEQLRQHFMQPPCTILMNMPCRVLLLGSKLYLVHSVFNQVQTGNTFVVFSDYCRETERGIHPSCIPADKHRTLHVWICYSAFLTSSYLYSPYSCVHIRLSC